MSIHEDWPNLEGPQRRSSSASRWLVAVGIIGGICLLVCCGGVLGVGWWVSHLVENAAIEDPEKVRELSRQIVEIDVPPQFEPVQGSDIMFFRMVSYRHKTEPEGELTLVEANQQAGAHDFSIDDEPADLSPAGEGQAEGDSPEAENSDADAVHYETREFEVAGSPVTFEVGAYKSDAGHPLRSVSGSFRGRRGQVTLSVVAPEDELNDAALERLMKSIRIPK
ncbi:MAG: hypothetical protein ACT4QC_04875 [Planctomycetaceae bacterium]